MLRIFHEDLLPSTTKTIIDSTYECHLRLSGGEALTGSDRSLSYVGCPDRPQIGIQNFLAV
jgi:hypothetical protein